VIGWRKSRFEQARGPHRSCEHPVAGMPGTTSIIDPARARPLNQRRRSGGRGRPIAPVDKLNAAEPAPLEARVYLSKDCRTLTASAIHLVGSQRLAARIRNSSCYARYERASNTKRAFRMISGRPF